MSKTKFKAKKNVSVAQQKNVVSEKLELMITIVNRNKADFYIDLIQSFEVNMQLVLSASGTAGTKTLQLLGLADSGKSVILSVIKRERASEAMAVLDEKFRTVKGGKGIAYTVPMTSTIGVAIYQFLSHTVG